MEKYTDEQYLNATAAVKQVEGHKESEAGVITPNEFAIINHYENLLNERPVIDTEAIEKTTRKLDGVTYQLKFIQNYFDLLSVIHRESHDYESLIGLHMSLFNNEALSSLDEIFKRISEVIDDSYVELMAAVGEE